ncbi:MAG: hypothetical protein B7Z66_07875 [Chromatiales bacterium 21-64-14]|nr:MAG: hypothetical protein B7Z66_07875 [Chromatiales bacterium 21-64-14]HQU15973.1 heme-binding protein [Gammaproteobacteria bacterium]
MKSKHLLASLALCALLPWAAPVRAVDLIPVRQITPELARDIAQHAIDTCRKHGYQVTAVVVDREGIPQVMIRDVFASRFTIEIAEAKANAVILSGVSSGEFLRNRADIRPEMDQVHGVLMLRGGLPIRAAGSLVGAVGVSGAPGGDKDEICARAGVDAVRARLGFAE